MFNNSNKIVTSLIFFHFRFSINGVSNLFFIKFLMNKNFFFFNIDIDFFFF